MGEIGGKLADFCIITEDNSRYEDVQEILTDIKVGLSMTSGTYIEIPDRRKAIEFAVSHAREGDMIAIIGKGHEDYQEIKACAILSWTARWCRRRWRSWTCDWRSSGFRQNVWEGRG